MKKILKSSIPIILTLTVGQRDRTLKELEDNYPHVQETIEVAEGEVGYNRGLLRSRGFYYCTAVIVDFGEEALLAHAYASYAAEKEKRRITDTNVIATLEEEARNLGFKLREADITINSGDSRLEEKVVYELNIRGIEKFRIDRTGMPMPPGPHTANHPRTIEYNPKTNKLSITQE